MRTPGTKSTKTTAEGATIAQVREDLAAIERIADDAAAAINALSASLGYADMDPETLGYVADVLNAASSMQAAAHKACQGLVGPSRPAKANRSRPDGSA